MSRPKALSQRCPSTLGHKWNPGRREPQNRLKICLELYDFVSWIVGLLPFQIKTLHEVAMFFFVVGIPYCLAGMMGFPQNF